MKEHIFIFYSNWITIHLIYKKYIQNLSQVVSTSIDILHSYPVGKSRQVAYRTLAS